MTRKDHLVQLVAAAMAMAMAFPFLVFLTVCESFVDWQVERQLRRPVKNRRGEK